MPKNVRIGCLLAILAVVTLVAWRIMGNESAVARAKAAGEAYESAVCFDRNAFIAAERKIRFDDAMSEARGRVGYDNVELNYLSIATAQGAIFCGSLK